MGKKQSKWDTEVRIAKEGVETGLPPLRWGACSCKDNELLLRFLTAASEKLEASAADKGHGPFKLGGALGYAATSVRKCNVPITSKNMLLSLHKVGPRTMNIVADGLWSRYPPSEEYAGEAEARPEPSQPSKKKRKSSGRAADAATDEPTKEPVARTKKTSTAQKEYVPRRGTANYAFLMCMFRALHQGQTVFGKKELMDMVEASRLADKSVFGAGGGAAVASGQVHKAYDGWSCMQKLVNGDPPLVHKFSNPVKVRLTPDGESLAARLYAIAVTTGDQAPLPGFDAAETLAEATRNIPATYAGAAADSPGPAAKPAPKRKAKATKAQASSAAVPDEQVEGGEAAAAAVVEKPSGRSVAKSMGAKLAAVAQKTKKRRRTPMEFDDLPETPTVSAQRKVSLMGSDLNSNPASQNRTSACRTPAAAPGTRPAAPRSSPLTCELLDPAFDPMRQGGAVVTSVTAPPSASGLMAAAARLKAACYDITPSTGGGQSPNLPSGGGSTMMITLPALPSNSAATAAKTSNQRPQEHRTGCSQQLREAPTVAATPPKASGNVADVVDLLDSDENEDPPPAVTPAAAQPSQAAAPRAPVATPASAGGAAKPAPRATSSQPPQLHAHIATAPQGNTTLGSQPLSQKHPVQSSGRGPENRAVEARCSSPTPISTDEDDIHCAVSFAPPPSSQTLKRKEPGVSPGATAHMPATELRKQASGGALQRSQSPAKRSVFESNAPRDASFPQEPGPAQRKTAEVASQPQRSSGLLAKCVAVAETGGLSPNTFPASLPATLPAGRSQQTSQPLPQPASQSASQPASQLTESAANVLKPKKPRTKAAAISAAGKQSAAPAKPPPKAASAPAAVPTASGPATGASHPLAACRTAAEWKLPVLTQQSINAPGTNIRHPRIPPDYTFHDLYEIIVCVDQREQFDRNAAGAGKSRNESLAVHLEHIRATHAVEARTLPVGDIAWIARCHKEVPGGPPFGQEWVLDYIVERKGGDDLVSSIHDGRYNRQKIYMARCGLSCPCYVVEGCLENLPTGSKAAKTATCETEIFSGFKVLHSENQGDTKRLYVLMTQHLKAAFRAIPKGGFPNHHTTEPLPTFTQWEQTCADNMRVTVRDIWGRMLQSIPRIGPEGADAIMKQYPTAASLFKKLRQVRAAAKAQDRAVDAACVELLARIPITLSRKVGACAARSIHDVLFAINAENM